MIIIKIWYHIWAIVKKFFYKIIYRKKIEIAKNVTWRRDFSIMVGKNGKLQIEKDCFFNNGCTIGVNKSVVIEKGSIFGENVKIYDHNHKFADITKSIKSQWYGTHRSTLLDRQQCVYFKKCGHRKQLCYRRRVRYFRENRR